MLKHNVVFLFLIAFLLVLPFTVLLPRTYATGSLYLFFGTFDESTGLLTGQNTTVTIYPSIGTPYNITLGPGNPWQNVYLNASENYFRIWLSNNMSRYYYPMSNAEIIYLFQPATLTSFTYYVNVFDSVGMTNAYVESYVNLNGTQFILERRPFVANNRIPFVLTQFQVYGFKIVCSQGVYDEGQQIAGDYTIIPAWTFQITPLNFMSPPVTYGDIGLSVTRVNDSWIEIQYYDAKNQTISVSVQITDKYNNVVYLDSQNVTQTYLLNYYDAESFKDYLVTVTVNHQAYGSLTWNLPCLSTAFNTNPFLGLTIFGAFPFDISQFVGFFVVICVFSLFSARDHHIGLILAMIVVGLLSSPPVHWLGIPMSSVITFLCFAILYSLTRRKPT